MRLRRSTRNIYGKNIFGGNGGIAESDNKQNRMLFKLAVEMSMMMNLMAATQDIDKIALERLRGECVKEVARLNGAFSFEDALDWQKG